MGIGSVAGAVGSSLVAPTALTLGVLGAAAATGPTLFPRDGAFTAAAAAGAGLLGVVAGAGLEGAARGLARVVPGGKLGGYLAIGAAGAALAGVAHLSTGGEPDGLAAMAKTGGMVAAVAGAAGVVASLAAARTPVGPKLAGALVAAVAGGGMLALSQLDARRDAGRSYQLPEIDLPPVEPDVALLDPDRPADALRRSMPGVDPASVAWERLPPNGVRFLWERTSTAEVERVMREPAAADPRRIYVGLDEAPSELAQPGLLDRALAGEADAAREAKQVAWLADTAVERMVATGAFERGNILVAATTSSGFVNPLVPMTFEMSTRGDSAVVAVQAGHRKAMFELHNADRAAAIHEALVQRIHEHVARMPAAERPRVSVYGESFGAMSSQAALQGEGLGDLDRYGIDRAMYTGTPDGSQWAKQLRADRSLTDGAAPRVVAVRSGQHAESLTPEGTRNARVTLLQHEADPVALFSASILYDRPAWLGDGDRGEGVSSHQRWWPGVTGITTAIDQQNAQYFAPGTIESKGHDYRAEISYVMRRAYGFDDVGDEQIARMREYGRQLELRHVQSPPPAP